MTQHNVTVLLILPLLICFAPASVFGCDISGRTSWPCHDFVSYVGNMVSNSPSSDIGKCQRLVQLMPTALQRCKLDMPDIQTESADLIGQLEQVYRLFINLKCDSLLTPSRPHCASIIGCFELTKQAPGIFDKNVPRIDCGANSLNFERTKQCLDDRAQDSPGNSCSHFCKLARAMAEARAKLC